MTILTSSVEKREKKKKYEAGIQQNSNPLDQQMLPWTPHMKF